MSKIIMLQTSKKSLPEIRKTEGRSSERYWARVGGIFKVLNKREKTHVNKLLTGITKEHSLKLIGKSI